MSRAMDRQPVLVRNLAAFALQIAQQPFVPVHQSINQRGALEATLRRVDVNGRVALVREGYDCDCTSYVHRSVVANPLKRGLFVWQRAQDDHYESLDGPERTYFERPGTFKPGHWSRDCAAESYEETGSMSHVTISAPNGAYEQE